MVSDVEPYELMKHRLLNGAHSSLAYLGYLAGYETVSEAMGDGAFDAFVRGLMEEVTPTLAVPAGADLAAYKAALVERFRNPALKHRTWQICMDGSQKLPQRLLGSVRDCLAAGAPFERLALGIAGWMRYVTGVDERGRPIDVRDPMAARLAAAVPRGAPPTQIGAGLLAIREVFGADLPANEEFTAAVGEALARLYAVGAKRAVAELAGDR
jgi:fructuronate reductase